MIVTVDETEAVAEQVDIPAAVDVAHPGTFAAFEDHGVGRIKTRGAGIAPGHKPGGALHQLRGLRRETAVVGLDGALSHGVIDAVLAITATASISMRAPSSKSDTPTLALAGQWFAKISLRTAAYTG